MEMNGEIVIEQTMLEMLHLNAFLGIYNLLKNIILNILTNI